METSSEKSLKLLGTR